MILLIACNNFDHRAESLQVFNKHTLHTKEWQFLEVIKLKAKLIKNSRCCDPNRLA